MLSFIRAQTAFPHGLMEKAWAPRWKTETRWFQTHLSKTASKHRLLQNKDGACLRLIRLVCVATSLSVSARLTEADGWFGAAFRCVFGVLPSQPAFLINSMLLWALSRLLLQPKALRDAVAHLLRHTCCCRPISSPPEGPHLFRPGCSSSWDFSFDFISVFSLLIKRNSGRPGCSF